MEFGPGELEAVVAHFHGLGIHAGYVSPVERALESMQSARQNSATGRDRAPEAT